MAAWKEATCRRLEDQADRIEKILAYHGISAVVTGGVIHAGAFDFWVQVLSGQFLNGAVVLEGEMAAGLGVSQVQIDFWDGVMTIRVMVHNPVVHPPKLIDLVSSVAEERPLTMIFGVSEDGRPLLLHLPTADVSNILVAGCEGAGKTTLLRSVLFSLAARNEQYQFQAVVIDFHLAGQPGPLAAFGHLPHLIKPVASSLAEATQALDFLVGELEYRQKHDVSYPKILLVVDNLNVLLDAGQRPLINRLIPLLQYGAEVGVHLVLALAYPGGEFVDTVLKCDFPLRFIGRVENEKLARAAAGIYGSGAEALTGMGDFIAVHAGQMFRFQTATISDYDLYLAVEKLGRRKKRQIVVRRAPIRSSSMI